ncbi:Uncharacterized protein dnl_33270 [Desulfonema limicola]|uniref:Uncharacterized protein n=2 Tax=Desulfonema limicola TaxID=45656 RepID=A0A975B982_9BACT|nr:Uncharacterized protein dnl_33270 [Desulfonema limicola]
MAKILIPLTAMYGIWIIISLVISGAGLLLPGSLAYENIISLISLVFFLCLSSLLTSIFIIYAEPELKQRHNFRKILLGLNICLNIALFLFVRKTGHTFSFIYIINTANLLIFAVLLGTWIVTPLKRPAELIPLCVIMSIADLFSVVSGPSAEIAGTIKKYYETGMQGPAPYSDFILIKFVILGIEKPVPVFGLSDWVIITFLAAFSARFAIDDNITGKSLDIMIKEKKIDFYMPVTVLGLMSAIFMAHYLGVFLPALPVIVLFFLVYIMVRYPKTRQLTKADIKLVIISSGIMGGLMMIRYYFI